MKIFKILIQKKLKIHYKIIFFKIHILKKIFSYKKIKKNLKIKTKLILEIYMRVINI